MNLVRNPLALLPLLAALAAPPAARAAFHDATAETGVDFAHGATQPEYDRAGAAALDVDGDGWPDLLGARVDLPPVLYINQRDGSFAEEGAQRGMDAAIDAAAFGAADFDNDGDIDIFAVPHEGPRFFLLINDGTGHFTEQAEARGADVPTEYPHRGYSVGLVDFDKDGFLDIYVCEWGIPHTADLESHSVLLRNRGAEAPGHFENVTAAAGLLQPRAGKFEQHGFSAAWADLDGDGWPDLAAIVDFSGSGMYWNNGDGTFSETAAASGMGREENGMGVAVADYDGDGLLDVYVTSIHDQVSFERSGAHTGNKLYRGLGGRAFEEVARSKGVAEVGWGWGAAFFEYDNDGDFDLVATNGSNFAEGAPPGEPYVDALTDPTKFFRNDGGGKLTDWTVHSGIADTGQGRAIVVLDYDRDGDEDLIVTNAFGKPIVYRSDASENSNDWIRLTFEGVFSNRDGIGAIVRVTDNGKTQTLSYNPSAAYIGQREAALHFGLGPSDGVVDRIEIDWPVGGTQTLLDQPANQVLHVVEEPDTPILPRLDAPPSLTGQLRRGGSALLEVEVAGHPKPQLTWEKDGQPIEGAVGATLRLTRLSPADIGIYRIKATNTAGVVYSEPIRVDLEIDLAAHSVARWWNEFQLDAVRRDYPDPPYVARNLYHASAALWDAFWACEPDGWERASPAFAQERVDPAALLADPDGARRVALSHAVYRVLEDRYMEAPGAARSMADFRWLMEQFGCDAEDRSVAGDSPAAVGNRIGAAILQAAAEDGAADAESDYEPVNEPLVYGVSGAILVDPNRWQPLSLAQSITKNGIVIGAETQDFLAPGWARVRPFALGTPEDPSQLPVDPGPPPLFDTETHDDYVAQALEVVEYSAMLDASDGVEIDISPSVYLNNNYGTRDARGRAINPYSGEPYAANVVKRGDFWRLVAEYFSDGPGVEGPPGVWNMTLNEVADDPRVEPRLGGVGPLVSQLEWDVRAYLALNGALHDAAIATWGIKAKYDFARPMSMVRYLAGLGQSSDPSAPSYHPRGLPLKPGSVELITEQSSAPGARHEHLADHVGEVALYAWRGIPEDPATQAAGAGWIRGVDWAPYHLKTFPTPNFAGYVSGHTVFSRAGAEILTLLTGSPFFPGGLKEFAFEPNEFLRVEEGPSEALTIQVATYYDMADLTGLARLFCGVHITADDLPGRRVGSEVGVGAYLKTLEVGSPADGAPAVEKLLARSDIESRALIEYSYFGDASRPLSTARAPGALSLDTELPPGIYIAPGEEVVTLSTGRELRRVRARGEVSPERPLVVEFQAQAASAALVRGRTNGEGAVRVSVYRMLDGEAELVAESAGWLSGDQASAASVLAARQLNPAPLAEDEAALPAQLFEGDYRVVLETEQEGAFAILEIELIP